MLFAVCVKDVPFATRTGDFSKLGLSVGARSAEQIDGDLLAIVLGRGLPLDRKGAASLDDLILSRVLDGVEAIGRIGARLGVKGEGGRGQKRQKSKGLHDYCIRKDGKRSV